MLFTTLLSRAALFATVHAVPIYMRDVTTMQASMSAVQTAYTQLDTAAKALSDATSGQAVLAAYTNVGSVIAKATTDIAATGPLTLEDSLSLLAASDSMTAAISGALDDLVAHKSTLDQLGLSSQVLENLKQGEVSGTALVDTSVSKIPTSAQALARDRMSKIQQKMDVAIAAFNVPSAQAPKTGTTTTPAPTTGPATTVPPTTVPPTTVPPTTGTSPCGRRSNKQH